MRLLLVRHGRTEWNRDYRFQGQSDTPLSAEGLHQAALLRKRLKTKRLVAIYSSDLKRCRHTAEVLAEPHGLPVITTHELREASYGEWEGHTLDEIRAKFPETVVARWRDPERVAPSGGESYGQVRRRVTAYLEEVVARHPEGNVLVVSHGGALLAYLTGIMRMQMNLSYGFRLDNCSLTIAEQDANGCRLVTLNDMCHILHGEPFRPPTGDSADAIATGARPD